MSTVSPLPCAVVAVCRDASLPPVRVTEQVLLDTHVESHVPPLLQTAPWSCFNELSMFGSSRLTSVQFFVSDALHGGLFTAIPSLFNVARSEVSAAKLAPDKRSAPEAT